MIDYSQLLLLGAVAGFTIFLGLPLASLRHLSSTQKGFLNAFALGILIFLIIEVISHAWEAAEDSTIEAYAGEASMGDAVLSMAALFGGIGIGLLGLVLYETRWMTTKNFPQILTIENIKQSDSHLHQLFNEASAYKLAMMIAIGIGAHNFSEGLAIGQSYVAGELGLAILLIIGFGAHNATEGFGIAGPLAGLINKPKIRFLVLVGLIGGGPTFIGTLIGSWWISDLAYILFLSIAGGALIYVSMLMYNSGRKLTTNSVMMIGIFVGLFAGFITDLLIEFSGA